MTSHAVIEQFLADWVRFQDFYRRAAELCHDMCTEMLRTSGIRHFSSFRAKSTGRLREKLYLRLSDVSYATRDDILKDIIDLAGVRIALYLPGDRPATVRLLSDLLEDGVDVRPFPNPRQKRRGADLYTYTFRGYAATHLIGRMKASRLRPDDEAYGDVQIEIQIASALTHTWAEVEHDLVYKPLQGELSIAEYAWLDQVNGIVAAGDFALEQLQRTMVERSAAAGERFTNHYALASYIHSRLSQDASPEPRMGRADKLLTFLTALDLDRPSAIQHIVNGLVVPAGKTIVEAIADEIIRSDPTKAADLARRRLALQSEEDLENPYQGERMLEMQRRIKRHWASFDEAAWRIFRRQTHPANRSAHSWMDLDSLQGSFGLDEPTAVAIVAAHQAYLQIDEATWEGANEQLEKHAQTLEGAIARLYALFPDILVERYDT